MNRPSPWRSLCARPLRNARPAFSIALLLALGMGPTAIVLAQASASDEAPAPIPQASYDSLEVTHVASGTVYLSGGRRQGVAIGDRLDIERDGSKIGEVQVEHLADQSSACLVVQSSTGIEIGDRAVVRYAPRPDETFPEPTATRAAEATAPPPTPPRPSPPKARNRTAGRQPRLSWAKLSGTLSARWLQVTDAGEEQRDSSQSTLRVNLRARELGGSPYELRLRIRGREDRRTSFDGPTDTRRRDRLYELSLGYEPTDGRLAYQVGRIRSGPDLGFDYLDGASGEFRLRPHFGVGAFAGARSNVDEIDFGSSGQAYGLFVHYKNRERGRPFYAELLVNAVRETEEGDISREYLSIYGRQGSGSRWSFYQRADIDFNRGWRKELAGSSEQVSNLLLSANYRFSRAFRVGLSYDQRRRYRTFENRQTPEELFDDQLRDGLRLTLLLGRPRSFQANGSVGLRRQPGSSTDSLTMNASVFHSDLFKKNFLLALDYSGFRGETTEGERWGLRSSKYFSGGHDLSLTLGASETRNQLLPEPLANEWIRLSGTARLPRRFFVFFEYEVASGDDFEGERLTLQLGYRP